MMSANKSSPPRLAKTPSAIIQVAEVKRGDSNLSCSSTGSEAKFNIDRKDEPSSALSVVLKLTVSTICGIILGFVMEKARGMLYIFYCQILVKQERTNNRGSVGKIYPIHIYI